MRYGRCIGVLSAALEREALGLLQKNYLLHEEAAHAVVQLAGAPALPLRCRLLQPGARLVQRRVCRRLQK